MDQFILTTRNRRMLHNTLRSHIPHDTGADTAQRMCKVFHAPLLWHSRCNIHRADTLESPALWVRPPFPPSAFGSTYLSSHPQDKSQNHTPKQKRHRRDPDQDRLVGIVHVTDSAGRTPAGREESELLASEPPDGQRHGPEGQPVPLPLRARRLHAARSWKLLPAARTESPGLTRQTHTTADPMHLKPATSHTHPSELFSCSSPIRKNGAASKPAAPFSGFRFLRHDRPTTLAVGFRF
jgi:hypothetical protein